jgi:hypothetical protein
MLNDHQHSIDKTIELKYLSTSEKHVNSDDESIKYVHESLRKLEHRYLKHDNKQILFFDPVCDEKRLYKKSTQFVCLLHVDYYFANQFFLLLLTIFDIFMII